MIDQKLIARAEELERQAKNLRKRALRPMPDVWKVGQRIRYVRNMEWCCNAYEEGVIIEVKPENKETPANKYQVFYTRPDSWKSGIFWTTPDDVELVLNNE